MSASVESSGARLTGRTAHRQHMAGPAARAALASSPSGGRVADVTREDRLHRAIALGDELLRLVDALHGSMAGPYISLGVDLLREQLHGPQPLSTLPDRAASSRNRSG